MSVHIYTKREYKKINDEIQKHRVIYSVHSTLVKIDSSIRLTIQFRSF